MSSRTRKMAPVITYSSADNFHECDCHHHGHPNLDEIYPNLFLGNLDAAESAETLRENGITHIISVASRMPAIPEELGIKHKYYEIRDDHEADLLGILPEAVLRLGWILTHGDCGLDGKGGRSKVLVHCCMGKSRSGAVVIGYVMQLEKYSFEKALEKVKEKRHIVRPNSHFVELLRLWGKARYSPWCGEEIPKRKKLEVESEWVEIADEEDEWVM